MLARASGQLSLWRLFAQRPHPRSPALSPEAQIVVHYGKERPSDPHDVPVAPVDAPLSPLFCCAVSASGRQTSSPTSYPSDRDGSELIYHFKVPLRFVSGKSQ